MEKAIRFVVMITDYCNKILNRAINRVEMYGKEFLQLDNGYIVNLWVDELGNYLGGCQYKKDFYDMWTWSDVDDFYNNFLDNKDLKFEIISFRKYGEPKLSKPKELNGIKQTMSVDYIPNKCKCQIFIKGNDVYIKHNDYFSPEMEEPIEDIGTPLQYRIKKYGINSKKRSEFVYNDCWGSIVLRQQAWIKISNLKFIIDRGDFELDIWSKITRLQEQHHNIKTLENTYMARMWENLVKQIKKGSV